MSKLFSLTYISTATRPMTENDLLAILATAREFNPTQDITGMLLYRKGLFIQNLEGDQPKVMNLYSKIEQDERHRSVLVIDSGYITQRNFSEWSMGFRDLGTVDVSDLDGYTDFLDRPYEHAKARTRRGLGRAMSLLEMFKGRQM